MNGTFRLRIHEYLEIVKEDNGEFVIKCHECGCNICRANENYKSHVPYRIKEPAEIGRMFVKKEWNVLKEYFCPNCATMLQVDVVDPNEVENDLWDIQIDLEKLRACQEGDERSQR